MAENLDSPSFTFGIQDTMEMGMGNAELINDLLAPETASGNPEDVTPIIKEVTEEDPLKTDKPAKGKEIVQKLEGEEETPQDVIHNFLGDDDDNEEQVIPADSKKEKTDDEQEEEKPTSTFTSLTNDLLKLGVFTTEEGETETPISTPEEFLERFNQEKEKGVVERLNNFIAQFGEDYQDAFTAIFVKGVNPKEYFGIYNNIVDFTNLDLTQEDNQIAVIRKTLSDQGMEAEDITTEIERLKNYGDLEAVSGKYHKVLVKKEASKLAQKETESQRELEQKAAIKNQYIQNVNTILQEKLKAKEFDGIPINPKLANELQEFLLLDKWKTPSGETLTDFDRAILDMKRPENHAMKVKVALLLKILEKDPTLSTIQRTGVSKKSTELFSELARQKSVTKISNNSNSQSSTWSSLK
jgi:hypothetical protein